MQLGADGVPSESKWMLELDQNILVENGNNKLKF